MGTIGHCDITIAIGQLFCRCPHNRSTATYILKSLEVVMEQNLDLRQLSDKNHINSRYTECKEPEMFLWCYE